MNDAKRQMQHNLLFHERATLKTQHVLLQKFLLSIRCAFFFSKTDGFLCSKFALKVLQSRLVNEQMCVNGAQQFITVQRCIDGEHSGERRHTLACAVVQYIEMTVFNIREANKIYINIYNIYIYIETTDDKHRRTQCQQQRRDCDQTPT